MKSSTARELEPKTSEMVSEVVAGESFITSRMPDREALIMSGPETMDSGQIVEQDRT